MCGAQGGICRGNTFFFNPVAYFLYKAKDLSATLSYDVATESVVKQRTSRERCYIAILSVARGLQKRLSNPDAFRNISLVIMRPSPDSALKMEQHPLSAVRDCAYSQLPWIWRARRVVQTRDPLRASAGRVHFHKKAQIGLPSDRDVMWVSSTRLPSRHDMETELHIFLPSR
jgi:hypothetical protein